MVGLTQEQIDETNRLEEERVDNIITRWNGLKDIRGCFAKLGLNIRNPELERLRIIKEDDQAALSALETASGEESYLANDRHLKEIDLKKRKKAAKKYLKENLGDLNNPTVAKLTKILKKVLVILED